MLNKEDLTVRQIVYRLTMRTNAFKRNNNKHTMTDAVGNEWYRYDLPKWTFKVEPMVIVGYVKHVVRGELPDYAETEDDFYLKYVFGGEPEIGGETLFYEESTLLGGIDNTEEFFLSVEDAEAKGRHISEKRNAGDHSE